MHDSPGVLLGLGLHGIEGQSWVQLVREVIYLSSSLRGHSPRKSQIK